MIFCFVLVLEVLLVLTHCIYLYSAGTRVSTVTLFLRSEAWHLYVIFNINVYIFQVNPLRQTQIYSEVNIVRYISRLFPLASPYNYEATGTFTIITETDQLLDQLEQKLAAGDNKEQQSVLRLLNGRCDARIIVCIILMVYTLIPPCTVFCSLSLFLSDSDHHIL